MLHVEADGSLPGRAIFIVGGGDGGDLRAQRGRIARSDLAGGEIDDAAGSVEDGGIGVELVDGQRDAAIRAGEPFDAGDGGGRASLRPSSALSIGNSPSAGDGAREVVDGDGPSSAQWRPSQRNHLPNLAT